MFILILFKLFYIFFKKPVFSFSNLFKQSRSASRIETSPQKSGKVVSIRTTDPQFEQFYKKNQNHCLGTIDNTNKYYIIQTIMKYYLKTVLKNQEILSITILASLTTFVKCLKRNPTTIRVHKPLLPFMKILQKKSESLKIRLMST